MQRRKTISLYCGQTYCKYILYIYVHILFTSIKDFVLYTQNYKETNFSFRYILLRTLIGILHTVYNSWDIQSFILNFLSPPTFTRNKNGQHYFVIFQIQVRPFQFLLLGCMILIPPVGMRGMGWYLFGLGVGTPGPTGPLMPYRNAHTYGLTQICLSMSHCEDSSPPPPPG